MVNDRVCVKVQHLSQLFQGLIEFEMDPTCGKTRHKNVNVDLGGNGFIAVPVYNFSHFIICNSDKWVAGDVKVSTCWVFHRTCPPNCWASFWQWTVVLGFLEMLPEFLTHLLIYLFYKYWFTWGLKYYLMHRNILSWSSPFFHYEYPYISQPL